MWVAVRRDQASVTPALIEKAEASVLFGRPRDVDLWTVRCRRELVTLERWRPPEESAPSDTEAGEEDPPDPFDFPEALVLPLVVERGEKRGPVGTRELRSGNTIVLALLSERAEEARAWLGQRGWQPAE